VDFHLLKETIPYELVGVSSFLQEKSYNFVKVKFHSLTQGHIHLSKGLPSSPRILEKIFLIKKGLSKIDVTKEDRNIFLIYTLDVHEI
jgi:hypothetical protein